MIILILLFIFFIFIIFFIIIYIRNIFFIYINQFSGSMSPEAECISYVIGWLPLVVSSFVLPSTRKQRFLFYSNHTKKTWVLSGACLFAVPGFPRPIVVKQTEKNTHDGGIGYPKSVHEGSRPQHTPGMHIHTRGVHLFFCL